MTSHLLSYCFWASSAVLRKDLLGNAKDYMMVHALAFLMV